MHKWIELAQRAVEALERIATALEASEAERTVSTERQEERHAA